MISPEPLHALYCDVLVVGAGPAGSACARQLALAGLDVLLIDAQPFPREKTCGDGLVPDTHAALRALGVLDRVMACARVSPHARCVAPSGLSVDVPGELAMLPRKQLDDILREAAVEAGARWLAPSRFINPLRDHTGRVVGAVVNDNLRQRNVWARFVVLASGAAAGPLLAADLCLRRAPSAMALRTYVRHPGMAQALPGLRFNWHRALEGGYGWIFPGPNDTYNIGVGELYPQAVPDALAIPGRGHTPKHNLRDMFQAYVDTDPVAAQLWREGQVLGELKGAPLRCDLDGARWVTPGLLAVGDAIGATYAFSGEGIGKALETGMLAAQALCETAFSPEARAQRAAAPHRYVWKPHAGTALESILGHPNADIDRDTDAAVAAAYTLRLQQIQPQIQLYRQAAVVNHHPWLINLVVWRARHSRRIVARMADILAERRPPGSVLSWRGLKRLILG